MGKAARMIRNDVKPDVCACCGFETEDLKFCEITRDHRWFCELCIHTAAGGLSNLSADCVEVWDILQAICYVGNAIIAEIRKGREGK